MISVNSLPGAENRALLIKAKAGDKRARDSFIMANTRLVIHTLRQMRLNPYSQNWDDYFQVGCMGLMEALDKFDMSKNFKFSTLAVPIIKHRITRYRAADNTVKIGRQVLDGIFKHPEKYPGALRAMIPASNTVFDGENVERPIFDIMPDASADPSIWDQNLAVHEALSVLDERGRYIVKSLFYGEKSQAVIARSLGVSQMQVSRLYRNAIKKMREYLED
jgi:RNA polymerase sporulation-specific sigma factor